MLPGKVYRPEDLLRILRKRVWLVLVPWAIVAAGTAVVARKLPDTYRSYAAIQVVPPRVSGSVVPAAASARPLERLQRIQTKILTRNRLERLIADLNLYQKERASGAIMQDLVERLISEVRVNPGRGDVFTVEYFGSDRRQVQQVAEKLADFFISESVSYGELSAETNQTFMKQAVADALRKLETIEEEVKKYKSNYASELPEQLASNQHAVSSMLQQLGMIISSIEQDTNTRLSIERQIAELEVGGDPGPSASATGGETTAAQRLEAHQRALTDYKTRGYSDTHEDVRRTKAAIAVAKKDADAEALKTPVASGGASPGELARRRRLAGLQDQLEDIKKRVAQKQQQEKYFREQAAVYQSRVDRAPMRSAEMLAMTREYEVLKRNHENLVNGRESADMSVQIETKQHGEQFNMLEPARLPERPFSPDRPRINFLGIAAGLAIGLGLVALLEYRDHTFKTDTELGGYLSLPVLAVVPLMMTGKEEKTAFRRRLLVNAACGSAVMVCVALLTYTFVY